jgi:hypothetical protein
VASISSAVEGGPEPTRRGRCGRIRVAGVSRKRKVVVAVFRVLHGIVGPTFQMPRLLLFRCLSFPLSDWDWNPFPVTETTTYTTASSAEATFTLVGAFAHAHTCQPAACSWSLCAHARISLPFPRSIGSSTR